MPSYYFSCAPDGDYMSLALRGVTARSAKFERGEIRQFSIKSRSRLMQKIAMLNKTVMPLFVTLTYPERFPTDFEVYKYDLHHFFISLQRAFSGAGVIWKLEYQDRGAPHFHMLLYGVSLSQAMEFIPMKWHEIAGGDDKNHLAFHRGELRGSEHCVQPVKSWRGVKSYASKYFTKMFGVAGKSGRFWGVRGKVPMSELLTLKIDVTTALQFRRAYRRFSGFSSRRLGFWAFGSSEGWVSFISRLEKDREGEYIPLPFPPGWWRVVSPVDLRPDDFVMDFY